MQAEQLERREDREKTYGNSNSTFNLLDPDDQDVESVDDLSEEVPSYREIDGVLTGVNALTAEGVKRQLEDQYDDVKTAVKGDSVSEGPERYTFHVVDGESVASVHVTEWESGVTYESGPYQSRQELLE